jgi:hypothetical protein
VPKRECLASAFGPAPSPWPWRWLEQGLPIPARSASEDSGLWRHRTNWETGMWEQASVAAGAFDGAVLSSGSLVSRRKPDAIRQMPVRPALSRVFRDCHGVTCAGHPRALMRCRNTPLLFVNIRRHQANRLATGFQRDFVATPRVGTKLPLCPSASPPGFVRSFRLSESRPVMDGFSTGSEATNEGNPPLFCGFSLASTFCLHSRSGRTIIHLADSEHFYSIRGRS